MTTGEEEGTRFPKPVRKSDWKRETMVQGGSSVGVFPFYPQGSVAVAERKPGGMWGERTKPHIYWSLSE